MAVDKSLEQYASALENNVRPPLPPLPLRRRRSYLSPPLPPLLPFAPQPLSKAHLPDTNPHANPFPATPCDPFQPPPTPNTPRQVDAWVVVKVGDPEWVFKWRLQAEVQMRAAGKPGLTDEQVADFVARFMPAYKAYLPVRGGSGRGRGGVDLQFGR